MLAIIVVCAETDEEAADIAHPAELQWVKWMTGQHKSAPPTLEEARNHVYTEEEKEARKQNKDKFVIGSPETVKKQLDELDRKSTRLNSSHVAISYAVFCLKKKKQ